MANRIHELAQQLMREGYVDNEADGTFAALRILAAAKRSQADASAGEDNRSPTNTTRDPDRR